MCGFYATVTARALARLPLLQRLYATAILQRTMPSLAQRIFGHRAPVSLPALGAGQRVYAIGDIHGRLDLLTALCQAIEADDRQRGSIDTTVILLGDLIDRGPDSSGVVRWMRAWSRTRKVRFVSGNHEQMFLLSFYEADALRGFLRFGGRETLASYGLDPDAIADMPFENAQLELARAIPQEDRTFISGFETAIETGDYLFVHAGVRPNVSLAHQCGRDCRWIREPFLSHKGKFERYVVHGHTISDEVDCRSNRIGIDTGAYASGKLTALCPGRDGQAHPPDADDRRPDRCDHPRSG